MKTVSLCKVKTVLNGFNRTAGLHIKRKAIETACPEQSS